jgi:DNA-binding response OmpR family regulator
MAKLLIIDDDLRLTKMLTEFMSEEGFEVATASLAEDAYPLAAKFKPEVILLDVSLPDATGFQALDRLRQLAATAKVPIVLMSGMASSNMQRTVAERTGATEYVSKPFDLGEMTNKLRAHLGMAQQETKKQMNTSSLNPQPEKDFKLVDITDLFTTDDN